ncbi:MAG: hypothetical protein ACTSUV_03585 [Candidatus Ranarchaeia archaeon]
MSQEKNNEETDESKGIINQIRSFFQFVFHSDQGSNIYVKQYFTIDGKVKYYAFYDIPEVILKIPKIFPSPIFKI